MATLKVYPLTICEYMMIISVTENRFSFTCWQVHIYQIVTFKSQFHLLSAFMSEKPGPHKKSNSLSVVHRSTNAQSVK